MEREEDVLTLYSPEVPKMKNSRQYQQPTLPTDTHPTASMPPWRRRQHVDQTRSYVRMFCGCLGGFGLLMLTCVSPLSWVRLLVMENGLELYAGLWTLCSHELCWDHTPKPPYYLQYSRACFLISVLTMLLSLGWLFSSCLPRSGSMTANLDLKVSVLGFTSATCLLLCLRIFRAQVLWHTTDAIQSEFLWAYYFGWWSDLLFICAGIISFLNHVTSRSPPHDDDVPVAPAEAPRLGIGPVTVELPAEDEGSTLKMES